MFPWEPWMNRSTATFVLLAGMAALSQLPVWSADPTARPRARFKAPVSYHSSGRLTYATGTKERDRTIALVPVESDGPVANLDCTITDHAEDDFEYHGVLNVDDQGNVTTRLKELINAANILVVTPSTIKELADGKPEVTTQGHVEISGDVYPVRCTHQLIGKHSDVPLRVITHTRSDDGKIDLHTKVAFGPDGMPLSAMTQGTIKAIVTVTVDLALTRIAEKKQPLDVQPGAGATAGGK